MSQICRVCGKEFVVLYPHLWAYRTGTNYFCSWKCLRAEDKGKGVVRKMAGEKVNTAMKREAVEIAIAGGDPRPYLKACGSTSPDKLWYHIKKIMQEKDPETYAKIPDLRSLKKKKKENEKNKTELIIDENGIQIRKKAERSSFNAIINPLEVCAVKSRALVGSIFEKQDDNKLALVRNGQYIMMSVSEWKQFSKEILTALEQLGISGADPG